MELVLKVSACHTPQFSASLQVRCWLPLYHQYRLQQDLHQGDDGKKSKTKATDEVDCNGHDTDDSRLHAVDDTAFGLHMERNTQCNAAMMRSNTCPAHSS